MTEEPTPYQVPRFRGETLVVLDLETTGLNPLEHRLWEIACLKIHPDSRREALSDRCSPGQPIPEIVEELTGVASADVDHLPPFAEIAPKYWTFLQGAVLVGYNIHLFDLPFIKAEFTRCGIDLAGWDPPVIDVGMLYRRLSTRRLVDAVPDYLGHEHTDAHGALADVLATWEVLLAMLDRHADLPKDIPGLAEKSLPRVSENPLEALDQEAREQLVALWAKLTEQAAGTDSIPSELLARLIDGI